MKKYSLKVLTLIWMISVFCFSNQGSLESSKVSAGITEKIITYFHITNYVEQENAEKVTECAEMIIRKLAHYSIYTLGGILLFLEINQKEISKNKKIGICQLIGTSYAITDEIHQFFVPGRSCEIRDVCIDSLGILTGIIIAIVILKIGKSKIKR